MSIWPTVLPSGVNERSTVTHRAVNRAGSVRNFGLVSAGDRRGKVRAGVCGGI